MTDPTSHEIESEACSGAEAHLCGNYKHLMFAVTDLAARGDNGAEHKVFFIDDHIELPQQLLDELADLSGAQISRVSDQGSVDSFAKLPSFLPSMLRRNLSWTSRLRPIRPPSWTPKLMTDQNFGVGYVYHVGFFLSKVLSGHSERIVMRDDGYSNYVSHQVSWAKAVPRLLAGRIPRTQTWGEESWVDELQVVRPEQVPSLVRSKATKLTLDDLMGRLPRRSAKAIAEAFLQGAKPPAMPDRRTALLLMQPIDDLDICTTRQKADLYRSIADQLRRKGYEVVVKAHPREQAVELQEEVHLMPAFPIEGWSWLGQKSFDLAVSLNCAALIGPQVSFADDVIQLVPPDRFYAEYWSSWPEYISASFGDWERLRRHADSRTQGQNDAGVSAK